jgi:carbonic anhydrase
MTATDEFVRNAGDYRAAFDRRNLTNAPARGVAIVACMDARLDLFAIFGLAAGDAHVIRNAGGVVTEDVIRSLALSQRLLGTTEVVLVHHTDCGLLGLSERDFRDRVEAETGHRPAWPAESFDDVEDDVRRSIARVVASPFVPSRESVRGFVYDVDDGSLHEIDAR